MIQVNGYVINEESILEEMQYHPADSHDAAYHLAARCLVIEAVLNERARQLKLTPSGNNDHDYLEELIEREIAIPQATEAECRHYYQTNQHKFTTATLVAARHILLLAPSDEPQARADALALAETLVDVLQSEPDRFSDLAREHSACDSATTGGELGQLSPGQTVSEFERQVFSAPVGLIVRPIETRFGFHVVYVDQKLPGDQLDYRDVVEKIRTYLNERVYRKAVSQYIETLLAEAEIDGIELNVSSSPLMQ